LKFLHIDMYFSSSIIIFKMDFYDLKYGFYKGGAE
jgi:hypothetical protein